MLEVPAVAFYIATGALVVVSLFIIVFLFYLIRAARAALSFAAFLEVEGRRVGGTLRKVRRAFALGAALWALKR